MSGKGVSGKPFMLKYCLIRYKSQEMCDKAVDAFLTTSKFVPNWPFTKKMLENPDDVVFSNDEIDLMIQTLILLHSIVMVWVLLI